MVRLLSQTVYDPLLCHLIAIYTLGVNSLPVSLTGRKEIITESTSGGCCED